MKEDLFVFSCSLFHFHQESFIKEALKPLLKLVTTVTVQFPSGPTVRGVIMYKLIDVLYILGLRLGFELTRNHLTNLLQTFFKPFDHVYRDRVPLSMPNSESGTDLKEMTVTGSVKSQGKWYWKILQN